MDIIDTIGMKKINFTCLQETKWIGETEKELDNLSLWYT